MHQLIGKKNRIIIYLIFFITLGTISNKSLVSKFFFLPNIVKINVFGLSNYYNLEITEKLNKLLFKSIYFIDKDNIDKIISQYNLIQKYKVKKIYPKEIRIDIEPTKYIAQINNGGSFLIGLNGKLIKTEKVNEELPFLGGRFDSKKFLEFHKIINASDFKFKDLKSIFFYPSARWDIYTNDDILIKLPEQNLSEVLRIAYKIIKDDQFNNNRVIDLRISNHIITQNE